MARAAWNVEPLNECELCGENDFETLSRQDRAGDYLETVVCRHCGLVSHAAIPTDEALRDYYADHYRRDYNGELTPSAYRVVREWRRGERLLERLSPHLESGSEVLEIGSGIGCTVKQFELGGYPSSGIEPGEGFCRFSRESLQANVRQATLEELPLEPSCDLVLLVHVLEHLPHPKESLKRIRQLLQTGGLLYVEVPNFALPHAAPGRIFHFAHIYNFTRHTLEGLAYAAGFEPVSATVSSGGKDLGILFRAVEECRRHVHPEGYAAVRAVQATSSWSYYLRTQYVLNRFQSVCRYAYQRYAAKQGLTRILAKCRTAADLESDAAPMSFPARGHSERSRPSMAVSRG